MEVSDERLDQMIDSARRIEAWEWASAFAELRTLRAAPTPDAHSEVEVKALEWSNWSSHMNAHSIAGVYTIKYDGDDPEPWTVRFGVKMIACCNGVDAAKTSAQADFDQRVRSALTAEVVESGPVAAGVVVTDEMVERAVAILWPAQEWEGDMSSVFPVARAALTAALTAEPHAVEPVAWEFDRYINGVLMAEGVSVKLAANIGEASKKAAKLAARGPNGEAPVLFLAQPQPDAVPDYKAMFEDAVEKYNVQLARADKAEAERDEAQSEAAMREERCSS